MKKIIDHIPSSIYIMFRKSFGFYFMSKFGQFGIALHCNKGDTPYIGVYWKQSMKCYYPFNLSKEEAK